MANEGNIYRCKWERKGERYRVWVEKRRPLKAEGDSLEAAQRELGELICRELGDGEAVLDLEPVDGAEQCDELVALSYNEMFEPAGEIGLSGFAALYEGGFCETCWEPIGRRTAVPLPVKKLARGDLQYCWRGFVPVMIASEEFVNLLTAEERMAVDWRPIELRGKGKRRFYEVIAREPLKEVVNRTKRVRGWCCGSCGRRMAGIFGEFDTSIAQADLPTPRPAMMTVEHSSLVVPRQRWLEIRGKRGTKGVVAIKVVLLPDDRVWRDPEVPELTVSDGERRREGVMDVLARLG